MKKGFTLIELVTVLLLIVSLTVAASLVMTNAKQQKAIPAQVSSLKDAAMDENAYTASEDTHVPTQGIWNMNVVNPTIPKVVYYGKGVFYFPLTEASFGNGLAGFLSAHTNLEVTAMVPNVVRQNRDGIPPRTSANGSISDRQQDYGATIGYFVTFREKTR